MDENFRSNQRMCRFMRAGGALFILSVYAIYLFVWLWPDIRAHTHPVMVKLQLGGVSTDTLAQLSLGQRLIAGALSLPYLAVLTWAFYRLDRMLRCFERGEFFDRTTVGHLRAFSGLLLLAKLLSLLVMHVRVATVAQMLEHHRSLTSVNLSIDDMAVLLMCALFFLIARMMEEARRLAEENKEFI